MLASCAPTISQPEFGAATIAWSAFRTAFCRRVRASVSFNPMYGQGMFPAAGQALALRAALKQSAPSGGGIHPWGWRRLISPDASKLNAQAWSAMETRDLAFPGTQLRWPAAFCTNAGEPATPSAASRKLDSDVHRLSVRVLHLMEPTSALHDPKIMQRAMALAGES